MTTIKNKDDGDELTIMNNEQYIEVGVEDEYGDYKPIMLTPKQAREAAIVLWREADSIDGDDHESEESAMYYLVSGKGEVFYSEIDEVAYFEDTTPCVGEVEGVPVYAPPETLARYSVGEILRMVSERG